MLIRSVFVVVKIHDVVKYLMLIGSVYVVKYLILIGSVFVVVKS